MAHWDVCRRVLTLGQVFSSLGGCRLPGRPGARAPRVRGFSLFSLAVFRYWPMAARTAGTISVAQRASALTAGVSSVLR
jgi:hypothetical protein